MGLRERLADAIAGRKSDVVRQERLNRIHVNPICSAYENLFAQVRPVVNRLKMVTPYGVSDRGTEKTLASTKELAVLIGRPNENMSYLDFMDTVFVSWLTLPEVNIHVHRNKRGRVIGYTLLPSGCRVPRGVYGNETDLFRIVNADGEYETLTPDEVMTIRFSRSPLNVDKGVSPADAVFIWSQIDDLMAQYQKAHLENGAVPAHITIVRASTREGFEAKKRELERGLSGARNKNKTAFIWRQQLDDGSTGDEMEVKTIQGPNSTLALKEIISTIDDRLNKAYGVSNFIMGDDSSAKYDNAELSKLRFAEDVIYPMLTDFWNKFQFELDRITGGLGYAITFDLKLPELTDRSKVRAETKKTQVESLKTLIEAGSGAAAAVEALGLSDEWLQVATGMVASLTSAQNAPEGLTTGDIHVHTCTHDHKTAQKTTDDLYTPVFEANEQLEKKIYDALMDLAKQIADQNANISLDEAKKFVIEALTEEGNAGALEGAKHIEALLQGGQAEKAELQKQIADNGFQVSEDFERRIQERVDTLVENFEGHTRNIVEKTFAEATEAGKSASQIKTELAAVLPRYRAETIARNEVRHAFQTARLETDEAIAKKYGFRVKLVWSTHFDDRTCEVCEAMDGTETILGEAFADSVTTKDGTVVAWEQSSWNDYGREPNAHVNCRCTFNEEFV